MRPSQSSATAMATAAQRALEMADPAHEPICWDPIARELIPSWFYAFMKCITATRYAATHASGALGFIVARCRYMDDVLSTALEGIQQLVILGAGFDSRAYRFGRLKDRVKVFEVDHPATQKKKLKKLTRFWGSGGIPGYITFVPVDFTRESLVSRLRESGYSEQLKTLFIWEGVTPYLDKPSVDRTLAFVVAHSAPGSAIVFDYMCAQPLAPRKDIVILVVSFLRSFFDEVRGFEMAAAEIEPFLASRGFTQVCIVTAADLQARYFTGTNAGRKVSSEYASALAWV